MTTKTIISKAPTRISFAGGGTDLESYFSKYGGVVLSTSISPSVTTIIRGDHIEVKSDVPPKTGLGGSSAYLISWLGALFKLFGREIDKERIAKTAYYIERKGMNVSGGWQDFYASAFGGFNLIILEKNDTQILNLRAKPSILKELEENLLLIHIKPRIFNEVHEKMEKKISEGEIEAFNTSKKIAIDMYHALENDNLPFFGELLDESWQQKKKSHQGLADSYVNNLYKTAIKMGALGGKLTGAGGSAFFYCPDCKKEVLKALKPFEVKKIPFKFDKEGLVVK